MHKIDLNVLEVELKKRCDYPYQWHQPQNDMLDEATSFIYRCHRFEELVEFCKDLEARVRDYAYNRWLNYWSAVAVQEVFSGHRWVRRELNERHKYVDIYIKGIPFDVKTTVLPRHCEDDIATVVEKKRKLIRWLYKHQSKDGRNHFYNRLFLVLYSGADQEHWKLKAEIGFLAEQIKAYLDCFSEQSLERFIVDEREVLSDIIWCIA